MAVDYSKIWNSMQPDILYTATGLGVAAASMTAMGKRGLVEVIEGKPKRYKKKISVLPKIVEILKNKDYTYFFLHKENCPIGMTCSLKNGKVYDCWGEEYDVSEVVELEVKGERFRLV